MRVKFWGVRGSIPSPGKDTVRYGGNTACIELTTRENKTIIFDAGSGIRELGLSLMGRMKGKVEATLFFSHTHWDHIQGFPFFVPIFVPTSKLNLYAPNQFNENAKSFMQIMKEQMSYQVFPIKLDEINKANSNINYYDINEGPQTDKTLQPLLDEGIEVYCKRMNHPVLCLGYKIIQDGKIFIYTGDNEPYINIFDENLPINEISKNDQKSLLFDDDFELEEEVDEKEAEKAVEDMNKGFEDFIKNADVLVADTMYTEEEYKNGKQGWGHSSYEFNIEKALANNVKKLIFFHHEPMRSDEKLDELLNYHRKKLIEQGHSLELFSAYEGMELEI